MHRNTSLNSLKLAFIALAVGASGCGSRQYNVTGQVKYNGAVLAKPDGQIVFIGPKGEQVAAAIGLDGVYRATKVSSGLNRVVVYYPNPNAKKGKGSKPKPGEEPPPLAPPFLTPNKYASAESSGLSITVEKETDFPVDLTGPEIP